MKRPLTKRPLWYTAGLVAFLLLMAFAPVATAATVANGGITLTYPDYPLQGEAGLVSCSPEKDPTANTVKLEGVPEGATVIAKFAWSKPYEGSLTFQPEQTYTAVTGGTLVIPVSYPSLAQWPVWDSSTGEQAVAIAVFIEVNTGGVITKLNSKQWWVRCLPEPPPPPPPAEFQGCTPGYWRQTHHLDSWAGYAPTDSYDSVFGVTASFGPKTLLEAVQLGGGGERALARHAVSALLNAAHPSVNYAYSVDDIIAGVQAAYASGDFETFKDALDAANNAGCPLN